MSGLAAKADVLARMALELIHDEGFGVSRNVVSDNVYRSNYIPATKTLVAERWTAHDLRRTALTGMAELGVAPIGLRHIANHRTTTQAWSTLGVYVQYGLEKEK